MNHFSVIHLILFRFISWLKKSNKISLRIGQMIRFHDDWMLEYYFLLIFSCTRIRQWCFTRWKTDINRSNWNRIDRCCVLQTLTAGVLLFDRICWLSFDYLRCLEWSNYSWVFFFLVTTIDCELKLLMLILVFKIAE